MQVPGHAGLHTEHSTSQSRIPQVRSLFLAGPAFIHDRGSAARMNFYREGSADGSFSYKFQPFVPFFLPHAFTVDNNTYPLSLPFVFPTDFSSSILSFIQPLYLNDAYLNAFRLRRVTLYHFGRSSGFQLWIDLY